MQNNQREIFFVALLTMLGLAVRLSAPLSASFPLNDGGLFYQMIIDLQNNGFSLPAVTTYNFADVPYAYPPLAFYLYGLLSAAGIPLLKLMQYAPALVSTLTIPIFYALAKDLLGSRRQALFGAMAFALVPRAFDWLIMGGGVTRSLGFLFAILAIHRAHSLFSNPAARQVILTTLFSGLVVLTHPEASVHTAIAAAFFYLWKDRTAKGALRAATAAIGTLIIAAPWWVTVLMRHGSAPFHAAMTAASENSLDFVLRAFALIKFEFTDEPFMQLISVVGLLGLFTLLAQRKPALPIWLALIAFLEPRGGALYMTLPLCMSVGAAFEQGILPILKPQDERLRPWAWNAFIGFFLLYGMINASITASNIVRQLTLTPDDLDAFAWVKANTPSGSEFIVITQGLPFNDSTSEWFPILAERRSTATVFGYEWVNDGNFTARVQSYEELQKCANEGLPCLETWAQTTNFSHIYVREKQPFPLSMPLSVSPNYKAVYQTGKITIFERIP
ncbi:MAG: hypothetical protein DPW18_07655 [Chloroflexi bacterium]|nr:hypothetical protein [Chloroflexota bacterium]MDL1941540.1 hypothetical protein [Chloroflexi bacterium CFX2]